MSVGATAARVSHGMATTLVNFDRWREVARYVGRHGTRRVANLALISAVPPLMVKTAANPVRRSADRVHRRSVELYQELTSGPFFGFDRPAESRHDRQPLVTGRRWSDPRRSAGVSLSRVSRTKADGWEAACPFSGRPPRPDEVRCQPRRRASSCKRQLGNPIPPASCSPRSSSVDLWRAAMVSAGAGA